MSLRVLTATPFTFGNLGSFGQAEYMLLRQHEFPDTYDERDTLTHADHDRIQSWDWAHADEVWKKHLGTGPMAISGWVQKASPEQLLEFAKDALKADRSIEWTGCRFLGTVNRSNGYPVFTIELFAKHPESDTEVYSGPRAPNVSGDWRGGAGKRCRNYDDHGDYGIFYNYEGGF